MVQGAVLTEPDIAPLKPQRCDAFWLFSYPVATFLGRSPVSTCLSNTLTVVFTSAVLRSLIAVSIDRYTVNGEP